LKVTRNPQRKTQNHQGTEQSTGDSPSPPPLPPPPPQQQQRHLSKFVTVHVEIALSLCPFFHVVVVSGVAVAVAVAVVIAAVVAVVASLLLTVRFTHAANCARFVFKSLRTPAQTTRIV